MRLDSHKLTFITDKELRDFRNIDYINYIKVDTNNKKEIELQLKQYCDTIINKKDKKVYIDTETTDMDTIKADLLLFAFGDEFNQIVIDATSYTDSTIGIDLINKVINYLNNNKVTFVAHNMKYDYQIILLKNKINLNKIYCTMVAEQKIFQGNGFSANNIQGIKFNLKDVVARRLKITMEKEVRDEFSKVIAKNYTPTINQIMYNAFDIENLPAIVKLQEGNIETYRLGFYLNYIGFPLIKAISQAELEGFTLNTEKWIKNIKDNEALVFETEVKLDNEVRRLRDITLSKEDAFLLKGGKYDRERKNNKVTNVTSLFGEESTIHSTSDAYINWGSDLQIIEIFAKLKLMLPVKDNPKVRFHVPAFTIKVANKAGKAKQIMDFDKSYSYTTAEPELKAMLIEVPEHPGKDLINLILDYRDYQHQIDAFGYNYLDKINPITNKIHSVYRTETAETGRLQSGGGKKQPDKINSQNIPRSEVFRTSFWAGPNYSITTCDLSGAEVTIMCDKANDQRLYEWAVINDDAHSPIAQACWREVYLYRAAVIANLANSYKEYSKLNKEIIKPILKNHTNQAVKEAYRLHEEFIIDKKTNKHMRTEFKPITFGTVYGMFNKKCAKALNINIDEADVVINTIKNSIPDTFNMVEGNSNFVIENGYLFLNDRTNSRVWFPKIYRHRKFGEPLDFMDRISAASAARNYPIQGTQADMIKESMVEIYNYIKEHNLDCALLNNVHDELVYKQPKNMDGVSDEYKANPKRVLFTFDRYDKYDIEQAEKHSDDFIKTSNNLQYWVSFPDFVRLTMIKVANRYLKHFKMACEKQVSNTWVK